MDTKKIIRMYPCLRSKCTPATNETSETNETNETSETNSKQRSKTDIYGSPVCHTPVNAAAASRVTRPNLSGRGGMVTLRLG